MTGPEPQRVYRLTARQRSIQNAAAWPSRKEVTSAATQVTILTGVCVCVCVWCVRVCVCVCVVCVCVCVCV